MNRCKQSHNQNYDNKVQIKKTFYCLTHISSNTPCVWPRSHHGSTMRIRKTRDFDPTAQEQDWLDLQESSPNRKINSLEQHLAKAKTWDDSRENRHFQQILHLTTDPWERHGHRINGGQGLAMKSWLLLWKVSREKWTGACAAGTRTSETGDTWWRSLGADPKLEREDWEADEIRNRAGKTRTRVAGWKASARWQRKWAEPTHATKNDCVRENLTGRWLARMGSEARAKIDKLKNHVRVTRRDEWKSLGACGLPGWWPCSGARKAGPDLIGKRESWPGKTNPRPVLERALGEEQKVDKREEKSSAC
jgi:hypothetical protein